MMVRWEYRVTDGPWQWSSGVELEEILNELGARGWELVVVEPIPALVPARVHLVLRRPIPTDHRGVPLS